MERWGSIFGSRFFSNAVPVLFGVLGVVLTNLPFSLFGSWFPAPMYALMPVYYWCLVRPDRMSPGWAFLIGLLHDIISGGPVGVWAASFVAMYAVIDNQRDAFAGLSGWGACLGFATAMLMACTMNYLIISLYFWKMMNVSLSIGQFAVTSILFIVVLPVLDWAHRRLVGPLRSDF